MIGRLVQLGAAALTPMDADQRGPEGIPPQAPERWRRIARDACKQCERAWLPTFHPRIAAAELPAARADARIALLAPDRGMSLDTWLRSLLAEAGRGALTAARPVLLAIGPEGGFSPRESAAFRDAGATAVKVAPHVLRVETAAEAAVAVAAAVLMAS
jgi:16S rRNA (uracil1498-N3)-methyltransferase